MNIDYMIQILQETKEFMAHAYPLDVTSSGQTGSTGSLVAAFYCLACSRGAYTTKRYG